MTLQITSSEHGLEVGRSIIDVVRRFANRPVLAGGFLRDVLNGVQPKDMDFFMDSPVGPIERTDEQAAAIFGALGHKFTKLGLNVNEVHDNEYPQHLTVYESTEFPEDHLPLNLIYTTHGERHTLNFDLACCNVYMYDDGELLISREAQQDFDEKTITIINFSDTWLRHRIPDDHERSAARLIDHINRVKAKFPDSHVQFSQHMTINHEFPIYHAALLAGGLIGDPRTILPPEGQEPIRDEVRLEDGATPVHELEQRTAQRQLGDAQEILDLLETRARPVRDPAQVQPGLADRAQRAAAFAAQYGADEAFIQRVLANAQAPRPWIVDDVFGNE